MAIDEVLLRKMKELPVLRFYRWARPAVSFGYFEQWAPIRAAYPEHELVRRWTGGGIVPHGNDFTYSLMIVPQHPVAKLSTPAGYALIHGAVAEALSRTGIAAEPSATPQPKVSQACFENAVAHDVLVGGRKVAGAAQRRTEFGVLHQGSIQGCPLGAPFRELLRESLAAHLHVTALTAELLDEARTLAAEKYAREDWTRRV